MPGITLEGNTLGQKHRHYNNLVQDAIAKKKSYLELDDTDIKELIHIDVASHNKDVDYILKVLQSQNLLYVSRALKKCKWLVIDDEYADIINPEYLKTQLFPLMSMKVQTQIMKFIRKHIKDETRAEKFFQSEDSVEKAIKWLPKCSVLFIENIVKKDKYYYKISSDDFKKLCERSATIFLVAITMDRLSKNKLKALSFLRKSNVELYINAVDTKPEYLSIHFDKKTTNLIMKHCPEKVIQNFQKYVRNIHIPTFSKYMNKENVKEFLYKQTTWLSDESYYYGCRKLFTYENLKCFIQVLPESERFDFVKKVFIDKIHRLHKDSSVDSELTKMRKLQEAYIGNELEWYQMASFEIAFSEIQKVIVTSLLKNKCSLFIVLIKCARRNQQDLQTVIKYFIDKHMTDGMNLKIDFVTELLSHTNFCRYNDVTWNILDVIFKDLEIYNTTANENLPESFVESIIAYKLIKNQTVPVILENKMVASSLRKYRHGLKSEEQERIFYYIYNRSIQKVQDPNTIKNVEEFNLAVALLREVLILFKDWNKSLLRYPVMIDTIKRFIRIDKENEWKSDLSLLYDVNKSWRKFLFEESLSLKQTDEVAINCLKHDSTLLERYSDIVKNMCLSNKISLTRLLRKVRLYWSQSLANEWLDKYFMYNDNVSSHYNVNTRNLFTLMPTHQVLDFIYKYVPEIAKIDWDNIDTQVLSIQKNIAQNMHFARPHVPPDAILSYAKGDYLQYTIPSILAIFYNLNLAASRQYIPKLLDSPVSLQKHGIRLAVTNLEHEDLTKIFYNAWINSKNATIRTTLFKLTHKLLCKATCEKKIDELWELLKMFIGVLTFKEDKKIYEILSEVDNVPLGVKPFYIETSYKFLESYIPHSGSDKDAYEWRMFNLLNASKEVMELINDEFIVGIIHKYFDSVIKKESLSYYDEERMLSIVSTYLLCAKEKENQTLKYNNILRPLLQRFSEVENLNSLLTNLTNHINYVVQNDMVIPVGLFSDINDELVKTLNVFEDYEFLKRWKIILEWIKIIEDSRSKGRKYPDDWKQEGAMELEELGKKVVEVLKTDMTEKIPCIYIVYDKLLYNTFNNVFDSEIETKLYKSMLFDQDFIPIYLAIARQASYSKSKDWNAALEIINNHPSLEVKMHCDYFFKRSW